MHDADGMCALKRTADGNGDVDGMLGGQRPQLCEQLRERLAGRCLAHDERMTVLRHADVEHAIDMRALERRSLACIGEEAQVHRLDRVVHREEDLHVDPTVGARVERREMRACAIGAEEGQRAITSGQRVARAQREAWDESRPGGGTRRNREQHGVGKTA